MNQNSLNIIKGDYNRLPCLFQYSPTNILFLSTPLLFLSSTCSKFTTPRSEALYAEETIQDDEYSSKVNKLALKRAEHSLSINAQVRPGDDNDDDEWHLHSYCMLLRLTLSAWERSMNHQIVIVRRVIGN